MQGTATARPLFTRPPERAETRSSPKRALFHCARSGSKGIPRLPNPPLTPQTEYFQLSPFLLTPRDRVAGWADQLLLRASNEHIPCAFCEQGSWPPVLPPASHDHLFSFFLFHTPRLAGKSSPRLRASNEGLLRPRVPRAKRALFTASHSRHIPYQANTAPPHRRTEGQDRAAYRRRLLNR